MKILGYVAVGAVGLAGGMALALYTKAGPTVKGWFEKKPAAK